MTTRSPIKSVESALKVLEGKINETNKLLESHKSNLGEITDEEAAEARNKFNSMIESPSTESVKALTPRDFDIIRLQNTERELERLTETSGMELIAPNGSFVMLPKGERLASPAGFHPDEQVFVKPSTGAIVSKSPNSSNMDCYDFTK